MDFKGEFKAAGIYKPGDVVLLNKIPYMKIGVGANVSPTDTTQWIRLTGVAVPSPGPRGRDGRGLPPGGTTGQVPVKNSNNDFDIDWAAANGGGITREEAIALILSLT